MNRAASALVLVALLASAASGQSFSFTKDEFDGSVSVQALPQVAAPNPTNPASGSAWTVKVGFEAVTLAGVVSYSMAVAIIGKDWAFPEDDRPLRVLHRSAPGEEWVPLELLPAATASELSGGSTIEVVGYAIPDFDTLRKLCNAQAFKFRVPGRRSIERLIAPAVIGFDTFDDFVEEKGLATAAGAR